jgi:hypothetical protein
MRAPRRVLGGLAAATSDLPRQGTEMALGVGARLGAALAGRRMLRRTYLGPLIERSRALSGATVILHGVQSRQQMGEDPRRGQQARHFHILEVTVKPSSERPGWQKWTPEDLVLVAPGALPSRPEEDQEVGRVFRAERWYRGRFFEADGSPLYGPQRLRLHVGLLPSARRFHFRYYLELLSRTAG